MRGRFDRNFIISYYQYPKVSKGYNYIMEWRTAASSLSVTQARSLPQPNRPRPVFDDTTDDDLRELRSSSSPLKSCYGPCGSRYKSSDLSICSSCNSAHYCSKTCQRADWQKHKVHCSQSEERKQAQAFDGELVAKETAMALSSILMRFGDVTSIPDLEKDLEKYQIEKFYLDLGVDPPKSVRLEAVDAFQRRKREGLEGRDNPIPAWTDAEGRTHFL